MDKKDKEILNNLLKDINFDKKENPLNTSPDIDSILKNISADSINNLVQEALSELLMSNDSSFIDGMRGALNAIILLKWSIDNNGLEHTVKQINDISNNVDMDILPSVDSEIYDSFINTLKIISSIYKKGD